MSEPVLEVTGVSRGYGGLRPLRVQSLAVGAGERVAVLNIDSAGAEVLVNLVTGAALPEAGTVRVFGRQTSEITSGNEWLASLDRFGIVSPRAVLMEASTLQQNLAMPFTLEIDPVPAEIAAQVAALAAECGIDSRHLDGMIAEAPAEVRARVHLARAVALRPSLLVLEHPTAAVPEKSRAAYADNVFKVLEGRRTAALVLTQDRSFAERVANRILELQPADGVLRPRRKGWFS